MATLVCIEYYAVWSNWGLDASFATHHSFTYTTRLLDTSVSPYETWVALHVEDWYGCTTVYSRLWSDCELIYPPQLVVYCTTLTMFVPQLLSSVLELLPCLLFAPEVIYSGEAVVFGSGALDWWFFPASIFPLALVITRVLGVLIALVAMLAAAALAISLLGWIIYTERSAACYTVGEITSCSWLVRLLAQIALTIALTKEAALRVLPTAWTIVTALRPLFNGLRELGIVLGDILARQLKRRGFTSGLFSALSERLYRLTTALIRLMQKPVDAFRKGVSAFWGSLRLAVDRLSSSRALGYLVVLLHILGIVMCVVAIAVALLL